MEAGHQDIIKEHGFRVTDFQMWQEVLDMEEMVDITACRFTD